MSDLIDAIAECLPVFNDMYEGTAEDVAADIRDLIIARIPPLVWELSPIWTTDDDGGPLEGVPRKLNAWRSGPYQIIHQGGRDGLFIVRGRWDQLDAVFPTLEAAKAAANAHHVAQLCKGIGIDYDQ